MAGHHVNSMCAITDTTMLAAEFAEYDEGSKLSVEAEVILMQNTTSLLTKRNYFKLFWGVVESYLSTITQLMFVN